jgi:hypothetical protein
VCPAHVGMATGQNELREALRFARLTSSMPTTRDGSARLSLWYVNNEEKGGKLGVKGGCLI